MFKNMYSNVAQSVAQGLLVSNMKVKNLIEKLKGYEDFEVEAVYAEESKPTDKFLNIHSFRVVDIADIGYSEKVILLDLE